MTTLKYWNGTTWATIPAASGPAGPPGSPTTLQVNSVNGKSLALTGDDDVVITKGDLGLGSVEDRSDLNRLLSTAESIELEKKVPLPAVTTKTLSYSNGGAGGTTAVASATSHSFRMVVKLPVTTTSWKIKLRNYNAATNSVPGSPPTTITLNKIMHGSTAYATTGAALETGTFAGTPASIPLGATPVIPSSASWYETPLVTGSNQFAANTSHMIAVSWTGNTAAAYPTGAGQCWYWNSTAGADTPYTSTAWTSPTSYIPLDWVIEYTCDTGRKSFLVVGDNITEGIAGNAYVTPAVTATPLWRSPAWQWAAQESALISHVGVSGTKLADLISTGAQYPLWSRLTVPSGGYDGAIIALGSYDAALGPANITNMQTYFLEILAKVESIIGSGKPIYVSNIPARSLGTTPEARRQDYNEWLSKWPTGPWPLGKMAGFIDADGQTRGLTTAPPTLNPAHTVDGTNLSWAGQIALAQAFGQAIV